jgi:glycosyltransferase involved in cell wall biosynthesis
MKTIRKRTALIVDPSLRSLEGHHFGATQRLKIELTELDIAVSSLASAHIDTELAKRSDLIPGFERSIYGRKKWTHDEFRKEAARFADELHAATRRLRARADLIIMPAGDQATVLGLAQYLMKVMRTDVPAIVIWLLMPPNFGRSSEDPTAGMLAAEYGEAFRCLREVVGDVGRVRVCCETAMMADLYRRTIGMRTEIVAGPNMLGRTHAAKRERRPREPVSIVCTGNANVSKGYALLAEAIRHLASRSAGVRFFIHGTVDNNDFPGARECLAEIARAGPNVTVRTDPLPAVEYEDWLGQADALLMPYDPVAYGTRGSGIFNEASRLGIPVIVTRGCGFAAEAIEEGRAEVIERPDAFAVAEAVATAARRISELTARASAHAASLDVDRGLLALLSAAIADIRPRKGWLERLRFLLSPGDRQGRRSEDTLLNGLERHKRPGAQSREGNIESAPSDGSLIALWLSNGDHGYWLDGVSWGPHVTGDMTLLGWRQRCEADAVYYAALPEGGGFRPVRWRSSERPSANHKVRWPKQLADDLSA